MNPAQLLNPKAFAKEKAKKRTPNYGPQQSRKPVATEDQVKVKIPSYDPKALLAPKSASKSGTMNSKAEQLEPEDGSMGHLFERHYNVKNRDIVDTVKRKIEPEDDDLDHKKQKTDFGHIGGGGEVSEHLKKRREALAKDAPPNTLHVDLTNDNDDDDIIVTGESKKPTTAREVCLGKLLVKANCSAVPNISTKNSKFGKDFWPVAKITLDRVANATNVVSVLDVTKKPFGRLDAATASAIAQLLDGSGASNIAIKAFLEQRVRRDEQPGQQISQQLGIMLIVYAPRDKADMIGRYLSQRGLFLSDPPAFQTTREYYNPQKPKHYGPTAKNAAAGRVSTTITSALRTTEEKEKAVNGLFANLTKNDEIVEMEPDTSIIRTKLLPHQKKALRFMVDHEDEENMLKHSLWQLERKGNYKEVWVNAITGVESATQPKPSLGGILADMMGLGKTLSILSVIAATKSQALHFQLNALLPEELIGGANTKATLIVCPTSVLANWEEQIKQHIHRKQLKVLFYHGTNRTQDLAELAKVHVVLTSYGVVGSEARLSADRTALHKMNWFRIVLDEAHQIRNAGTNISKAACSLSAQRRWAVTGTPVQNRLDDLGALIRFLRVKPFDEPAAWGQYIIAPFKNAKADVLKDLRVLVDSLTLRRTKDTIELPERTERVVRLSFTERELQIYNVFVNQSSRQLQLDNKEAINGAAYIHVLKALLRLRQICDHGPEMLSSDDLKLLEENKNGYNEAGDDPEMSEVEQTFTDDRSAYEALDVQCSMTTNICAVCAQNVIADPEPDDADAQLDEDSDADSTTDSDIIGFLTQCYHLLHLKCREKYEAQAQETLQVDRWHKCPIDERLVRLEFFTLKKSGLEEYREHKLKQTRIRKHANFNADTYQPHTKVKALVEELGKSAAETAALPEGEPPIRSVVFTEWTTYLDLIEVGLEREGITFVRLDGSMSVKARAEVLRRFRTDPDVTVLIVSIKAGGQGLNFTAANKVYVMEPQFNPGVEAQAVDRVHRLGQTRPVEITHFIMSESVEEGIVNLQRMKKQLASLSMEKKTGYDPEDAKRRIEEIKSLFKR